MKRKSVLFSLFAVLTMAIGSALIGTNKNLVKASSEHTHYGNHYEAKPYACGVAGYKEHWVCCGCHEVFLEEPEEGVWSNQDTLQYDMEETNPAYLAPDHVFDQVVATDTYKATNATFSEQATYYYSCTCGEKGTETFKSGDTVYKDFGNAGFSGFRLFMSRDDVAFKFRLTVPSTAFTNEFGIMLTFDELNASTTRDGSSTLELKFNNANWYGVFNYKVAAFAGAYWGTSVNVVTVSKDGVTTIDAFISYAFINGDGNFISSFPQVGKNTELGVTVWEYGVPPQGKINAFAFASGWYCDPLNPQSYMYVGADGLSSVLFNGAFTANEDSNLPL